ncbi:tRNA preQ1(34) S-adenosylmethionine ribosyltransferase-isomerase QueA [Alkalihalobacillus pseudalcaliphilus]|uniref:tRNA preQ1(34) S-adenosylmethionine ribosyltransferase-isomerase QueA n=1 Tax=Alkalihalobacillus pseudalcaliphilus TaxID=79884 RepID=UPI00064DC62D|nr:tRNA preQ1(34) S-adenosylmethionine ribosyltransferase-isomerase QueA [Alkalihalobacillus pseudalcaliphilus]KMK75715.1 S-adenosylmethionine tRNA ribosyltransferase [Alkalihalobacillus pseudalcaliphilus]
MHVEDFDFHLPEHLIAQTPLQDRTASRLLVLNKQTGEIQDDHFPDVLAYLQPGDCLVLNDTRVLPARLFGVKAETGAKVEVLLLKQVEGNSWETLVKPAKRVKVGTELDFGEGMLKARCTEELEHGGRVMELHFEGILHEVLDKLGEMPLPPYIREQLDDRERYQTVFAEKRGSAAAPTAGLHWTEDLLAEVKKMGIQIAKITLHVGLGTFRPVSVDSLTDHAMHAEFYEMSKETAGILTATQKNGGKIIAVGTTSARTLETIMQEHGRFCEASGWTSIFIYPGFQFKGLDALLTNFHLPKSTLVMLVSALAGRENVLHAYHHAISAQYRFFSFGDAMLITDRNREK